MCVFQLRIYYLIGDKLWLKRSPFLLAFLSEQVFCSEEVLTARPHSPLSALSLLTERRKPERERERVEWSAEVVTSSPLLTTLLLFLSSLFFSQSSSMPVFILLRSLVIRLLSSKLAGSLAQFLRRGLSTGAAHLGTALRYVWDRIRSQESKEAVLGCVLCVLSMNKKVEKWALPPTFCSALHSPACWTQTGQLLSGGERAQGCDRLFFLFFSIGLHFICFLVKTLVMSESIVRKVQPFTIGTRLSVPAVPKCQEFTQSYLQSTSLDNCALQHNLNSLYLGRSQVCARDPCLSVSPVVKQVEPVKLDQEEHMAAEDHLNQNAGSPSSSAVSRSIKKITISGKERSESTGPAQQLSVPGSTSENNNNNNNNVTSTSDPHLPRIVGVSCENKPQSQFKVQYTLLKYSLNKDLSKRYKMLIWSQTQYGK